MNEHSFMTTGRIVTRESNTGGDKYHRILNAAVRVFARQGFFQSTVSQVAREAGVADGTIYLYFKNKEDILVQFFSYRARQVFDDFKIAVDRAESAFGKLKCLIGRHLATFQEDRHMAVVYLSEIHQISRVAEPQIRAMSQRYADIVASIVECGQQEGSIRENLNLGLVKRMIIGAVDEVISTWLHAENEYDLTSLADPLADLLMHGIGSAAFGHARR